MNVNVWLTASAPLDLYGSEGCKREASRDMTLHFESKLTYSSSQFGSRDITMHLLILSKDRIAMVFETLRSDR